MREAARSYIAQSPKPVMVRKNGTIMAYQPLAEIYNVQCVLHEIARFPLEFSSWNFTLNPFGGEPGCCWSVGGGGGGGGGGGAGGGSGLHL